MPALFREFMALDRRRKADELTVAELARWDQLKRALGRKFQPDAYPEGADARQSVRVPVRLRVGFESYGEIRSCLMTNLSRGGLFIATHTLLPIGTSVHLRIQVAGREIQVDGVVASHSTGAKLGVEESCGMGIRFASMDPGSLKEIEDLYERALVKAAGPDSRSGATAGEDEPPTR